MASEDKDEADSDKVVGVLKLIVRWLCFLKATEAGLGDCWTRLDWGLEVKRSSLWIQDRETHGISECGLMSESW